MNRFRYFAQRLLLLFGVTFPGIILLTFLFTQLVPGGPVEQQIAKMRMGGSEGGASGAASQAMTQEQIEELKAVYNLDKPLLKRFWIWMVHDRVGMKAYSFNYTNKTTWELISERFPISLSFGIPSLFLTYIICIPLGIAKALKNGKRFDLVSSLIVFTLYALPTFAFGMVLKMLFCGTTEWALDWFPIGGFRSPNWESLSAWGRVKDQVWHLFLPVTCYVVGNFAVMTLLMKNSLLDQISQDYVRTVLAKGGTMNRAVWRHAVRNSLIPIVTGIGSILTVMFAGSVLIEQVFDIHGLGLLSLNAIIGRDYPLFLGIVCLQSILGLLGQVLTDFCYLVVDPRMDFGGGD
ncbi:ABC transporter permease subunit [Kiritimatiellota bacterium B12222]|nr:ABC transporter permease subunit [Kiritimatiellota bacterium B12222]